MDPYQEPKYPIGFKVKNRFGEEIEVVEHVKTQDHRDGRGRRIFSEDDVRRTPWLYVLRGGSWDSQAFGPSLIDDMVRMNRDQGNGGAVGPTSSSCIAIK
jgi:hypothetical protein